MSRNFDEHKFLYPETDDEIEVRLEAEKKASANFPKGVHMAPSTGKCRGYITPQRSVSVPRVKKMKVDVSSKAWKDYQDKKISFSEMKKRMGL